jgi:hypothetical protein
VADRILVCSVLGCLAGRAFWPLAEPHGAMARASAGVGAIWIGIVLGGLPWAFAGIAFLLSRADANTLRRFVQ